LSRLPSLPFEPLRLDTALQLLQHAGLTPPAEPLASVEALQGVIDALVELSSRDALTGLANRRSFDVALAREVDRVARSGEPALLLTLDIDHFKRINDGHGHAAGDLVIRAVARMLTETVRPMDVVARVGGEEFAVILPNCPAHFGQAVAERIRRKVENALIAVAPGVDLRATVSVGGAFAPQWVRSTPQLWTERADQQLYRAKSSGRNLVCLEPSAVANVTAEEKSLLFALSSSQDHE
jgi:diguanylate cyclase (GGDEF)-like protein